MMNKMIKKIKNLLKKKLGKKVVYEKMDVMFWFLSEHEKVDGRKFEV